MADKKSGKGGSSKLPSKPVKNVTQGKSLGGKKSGGKGY